MFPGYLMGGWIYFSRQMSLKYQTCCSLWLLSIHCYWFFIPPGSFPFSELFLLPSSSSSHRAHRFFLWFCIMSLSSHGLHNTFLLCCASKPQTKVILILTIQLNLAVLKVFSLSWMEVGYFDLLSRQLQMTSRTAIQQLHLKKRKEYGIMNKIVRD